MAPPFADTDLGGPERPFPTTRWSVILAARASDAARRAALEALLAAYWKPLYVHARRRGLRRPRPGVKRGARRALALAHRRGILAFGARPRQNVWPSAA